MAAEDTAKKWLELINKHDRSGWIALYTEDVVVRDPSLPEPLKGKDNMNKNWDKWFGPFPDLQFRMVNLLSKGDTVAMELVLTGTNKGPLAGPAGTIPPTNKRFELSGVGFWRVNNRGLIVEERRYLDTATMMRQLGLMQ